jgi:AcrR family transcriptional regulator
VQEEIMYENKTDRRVIRTRRQLRDALLSLILEKGYDSVTIEEITDRADVGRTTFYLHYRDKEELLLECINGAIDELVEEITRIPLSAWRLAPSDDQETLSLDNPILQIFNYVIENADLYRIIMRGMGSGQTQNRIREIIANAVSEFLVERAKQKDIIMNPTVPLEVFSNYFAGSLMSLVAWWLEMDMPYKPEEMTRMFQKMFFPGAGDVLGFIFI